jgi:uncharacterized protein YecT (DUF1311 family)
MKRFLLLLIFMSSSVVLAEEVSAVDLCFEQYSGVGSVECLEKIYQSMNQELDQLNANVLLSLGERDRQDIITVNHYDLALPAFKRSILDFKLYRKSSCDAQTYYSGAVASGSSQVLYKCLISQTEIHNQFLKHVLKTR